MRLLLTGLLICCTFFALRAQSPLNAPVSLNVKQQPLGTVLKLIAAQGNCYFSYNTAILPQDSLVSLSVQQQPLRQVLDHLFKGRYDYVEEGRYLILRPAEKKLASLQAPPMQVRDLEPVTIWERKLLERKGRKPVFRPLGGVSNGGQLMEIGGLFNINRGNGRNLQLAGVVNINEGAFKGVQLAGVHNKVLDTLKGVQITGLLNEGAGIVKGLQIAAINHARKLKGMQLGILNMADSSRGYSLGILNLIGDGYHQASLSTSDLLHANVSIKLGNPHLYSLIAVGGRLTFREKAYAIGFGLGHDVVFNKSWSFALQGYYHIIKLGTWDNRLMQLKGLLQVQAGKHLVLFAGPVANRYINNDSPTDGWKNIVTPQAYYDAEAVYRKATRNWIGWEVGIATPSLLKITPLSQLQSRKGWWLSAGPAIGIDMRGRWSPGVSAWLQKGWEGNISLLLATGWMKITKFSYFYPEPGTFIEGEERISLVPIKAGLKILTGRFFYVGAAAGPGFDLLHITKLHFTGGPLFGWEFGRHVDVGAQINYISGAGWQPAFRLAYNGLLKY